MQRAPRRPPPPMPTTIAIGMHKTPGIAPLIGYNAFGELVYANTPKVGPVCVKPSNYYYLNFK